MKIKEINIRKVKSKETALANNFWNFILGGPTITTYYTRVVRVLVPSLTMASLAPPPHVSYDQVITQCKISSVFYGKGFNLLFCYLKNR